MGWTDRLKELGGGIVDIFSAPIGLMWDTGRAIASDDYDPGFFGVFGPSTEQAITGLSRIGDSLGFRELGQWTGESAMGPTVRAFFDTAERIYSTEFQQRTNQGILGAAPGEISLQRGLGTVTGLAGELAGAPFGQAQGMDFNPVRQWEKSRLRSPGQALVQETINFEGRTAVEQEQIKETAWYNMISGTLDAAGRWFLDPTVLLGKGIKRGRNAYFTLDPTKRLEMEMSTVTRKGYKIHDRVDQDGISVLELEPGRNDTMYAVVKPSQMQQLADEGLTVKIDTDGVKQHIRDQTGMEIDDWDLNFEASRRGMKPNQQQVPDGRYPGTDYRPLALFGQDELDDAHRYAGSLYEANPNEVPFILELKADGLPVMVERRGRAAIPGADDTDELIFTMANALDENSVVRVTRPSASELTDKIEGPSLSGIGEPAQTHSPRFYNPDGSPKEPDGIHIHEDYLEDATTYARLYADSPQKAEQYLLARQEQQTLSSLPPDMNYYDRALNHRITQEVLNWLGKKNRSVDEITRTLFPNNPFGGLIASLLADARDYNERRIVLGSAMGYRMNGFETLEPQLRGRIARVVADYEAVQTGKPPGETLRAMLGEHSRWADETPDGQAALVDEILESMDDQAQYARYLTLLQNSAPIKQLSMPYNRVLGNRVRKSSWYQSNALWNGSRAIRNVVENRPNQFINVRDTMSYIQIRRQIEEAQRLGFSGADAEMWVNRYVRADNDQAKIDVAQQMEEEIITRAAKKAKMDEAEFQEVLEQSRTGRRQVGEYLASRRYATDPNRDTVPFYDKDTGVLEMRTLPLLSTQTNAWVPLADVREITRIASRIGRFKTKHGSAPRELLELFNAIWKPSVLLRGGWMIRVVSDEQLRILAISGSLLKHLAAIELGEPVAPIGIFRKGLTRGQRASEAYATATLTRPITALAAVGAKAATRIAKKLRLIDEDHYRYMEQAGVELYASARAAFGGPNEQSLASLHAVIGRESFELLDHLYSKGTGQWRSIDVDERGYPSAWARALGDQWGRDPLGRKVIQEVLANNLLDVLDVDPATMKTIVTSVKHWMRSSAEGREIAERMPYRSSNPERWIEDLVGEIGDLTGGFNETLLRGALDKKISPKMLEDIDPSLRPPTIHAEIIDQSLGNGTMQFVKDFVSTTFDLIGRLPTDTLSRQPFFKNIYASEMVRLEKLNRLQNRVMDEDLIARMDKAARATAIREVKTYLYDLAEISRFGDMMKFVMPFYAAWQEVFKVWGKIAFQDPSVIARARLLWEAPNKANMVYTDDEGNEFLQFRLSDKSADALGLNGWARYVSTGGIRIGKSSFNLVLNNPLPGVGPLIQIPVNEVVQSKPELEESLRFLLPFGVAPNSADILLSPLVRQLKSEMTGVGSDLSYQRAFMDVLTWMDVEYRAGRRTLPPSYEEAKDTARSMWTMRLVTRLASPAQPIFDSPLQPHIDLYRDMIQNLGPERADEVFLNEYGQEFFAVTLSRTVSKTGIPPTVEGEVARRQFEDIIKQYPEYGRLIVGDEALGEFSTAAFAAQLQREMDPWDPNSEKERTYRSHELDPRTGGIIEVDRRLGWQEYIQAMDLIELERQRLGLPNLRVKEAEQLAAAKQAVTQFIASKYPSWWDDFNTRDELKWDKRIEAFGTIASTPAITERADMEGLSDYLTMRQAILQELNRRKQAGGAATLGALDNQDLAAAWDTAVSQLLEDNIAFGPLYFRYLEGDPLLLRGQQP